jgi:ABC-type Zn2+ transport system substrate-binding protein/surface adhesin
MAPLKSTPRQTEIGEIQDSGDVVVSVEQHGRRLLGGKFDLVRLDVDGQDGHQPVHVWLRPDEARALRAVLSAAIAEADPASAA